MSKNIQIFKKIKKHHVAVVLVLSIAIILRLHLIFSQEFSFDERFTYFHATNNPFIGHFVNPQDDRPPFYYSFIKLILPLSSSKEFVRLPSLIFSISSAFFIYRIFNFFNKKAALYALIFYSTHSLLIHVSWQARDYSLLYMLSITVLYFLIKILFSVHSSQRIKKSDIFFLLVTMLVGILTTYLFYPFIAIVLFVFGLLLIFFRKKINSKNFLLLKKLLIFILPVIGVATYYLVDGFRRVINFNPSHDIVARDATEHLFIELFSFIGHWFLTKNIWLSIAITFLLLIAILCTYFKSKNRKFDEIIIQFFSLSFLLLFLFYGLISKTFVNLLIPRGWVVLATFTIFIVVAGWISLEEWLSEWIPRKLLTAIYILIFFVTGIFQYGIRYELLNFREYDEWIYPFPNQQTITTVIEIIENNMDKSTQLITFPSYETIIFDYEWRNNDFGNDYQQFHFGTLYKFESEVINDSELFDYCEQHSQEPVKIIAIVNQYFSYTFFKNNDPRSHTQTQPFNFIDMHCEKEWVSDKILDSYDIWGCILCGSSDD